jgi:hypothetical protein
MALPLNYVKFEPNGSVHPTQGLFHVYIRQFNGCRTSSVPERKDGAGNRKTA